MMETQKELLTLHDIKKLVDTFYDRIKNDSLLAPIFNERIKDNWPLHLEKMYRFWQTVLLEEHAYFGSPLSPHLKLPVDHKHFKQWLSLLQARQMNYLQAKKLKKPFGVPKRWQKCLSIKSPGVKKIL